jgi:polyhydroxyalkanoate synthesis regulator phasin
MKNPMRMKKFIGGLVIGGLLLGGGGLALATGNSSGSTDTIQPSKPICGPRMAGMKAINSELMQSVWADLVAGGTLTQEQVDQIQAKQKEGRSERLQWWQGVKKAIVGKNQEMTRPSKQNLLAQMVSDGVITQTQADAIQAAVKAKATAQRQERLQTVLDQLIADKIINSEQAAAVKTQLIQQQADRQEQRAKLRSMTPEQRKAFRQENKPAKINPLADLVANGTITQDQADQVMKALRPAGAHEMHRGGRKAK